MSIIIHGMKLPKEGRITIEIGSDGVVYSVTKKDIWGEKYESDFPACEIPPHGDLIDRDVVKKFPIRRDHYDRINGNPHFINGIETVMEYIDRIPTIIEASE